ncbi:MAG TPA: hypothetical protein VI485_13820 [Vicinamibacterales bacterium]|nr:hypothetical protein [Vicinamibacterales bacterium]
MSDRAELPRDVKELVLRYIDSVAELEALLLLRAEEGPWCHETLARRLYVDDRTADEVLMALHRGGLVSRADDGFRYAPRSDARQRAVDALADSYPKFLIPMTHLIHSKSRRRPMKRSRSSTCFARSRTR